MTETATTPPERKRVMQTLTEKPIAIIEHRPDAYARIVRLVDVSELPHGTKLYAHTDDQSRELDECRKLNAELREALADLIPLHTAPHMFNGYFQEEKERRFNAAKALLSKSQPHRPEPATPAGELSA